MSDEKSENNLPVSEIHDSGEQGESFADLIEKSANLPVRLEPGEKIKARVISITSDYAYVYLGGKSEGIIPLAELTDETGKVKVKEGDDVEAFFVSVQDGVRKLTTMVHGYSLLQLNAIHDAFEAGTPVHGEVKREVKGGFEVSVGGVRCFCPFSQIDMKGGREGGVYLGQTFPFKVLEFAEDGRNVILSRRSVLEELRQAKIEKLRETLETGMVVTAPVSSLQKFGAFVDLGGIEALIPVSEMSWGRTGHPGDILSVGQEVTAKIICLDWDNNRLTLSLKSLQPDPWSGAVERYKVGSRVEGLVVRLVPFGAFVSLEAGIDGLIHISNLGAGRRINHPKEVIEVGQRVECYVLAVDPEKKKISLSMQEKIEPAKVSLPAVGDTAEGTVERVMPFGIFLKMAGNVTGLIPNSEMGTSRGADHSRMFPVGSPLHTVVIEVDADRGKVLLSRKAAMEKAEKDEFYQYKETTKSEQVSSSGLGRLGEILKAKMEEKKGSD